MVESPKNAPHGVPRALHMDEESAVVIMEACRGVPLDRAVKLGRFTLDKQKVKALEDALTGCGRWLRIFQQRTGKSADARTWLDALIDKAGKDLAAVEGGILNSRDARTIGKKLAALSRKIVPSSLTVCGHHGDFWPGNIYFDDGSVRVIDFEGYRHGLALEDPANFLVYLELFFHYPTQRRRGKAMVSAFVKGYGEDEPFDPALMRLCKLTSALRILSRTPTGLSPFQRWRRRRVLGGICLTA